MSKQQVCTILRDFNEDNNAMIAMDEIDVYDLLYRCSRLECQLNDLFNGPKAKLTIRREEMMLKKRITSCVNELDNTYGDLAGSDDN